MKQNSRQKKRITIRKGSALMLTTILLFVVLSIVMTLSYITVMEQKISSKTKSSVVAFFTAESGVEWALNKIANVTGDPAINSSSAFGEDPSDGINCPSGFSCTLYLLDEEGRVITDGDRTISEIKAVRVVGSQGGETQRAIEAAVAEVDEGLSGGTLLSSPIDVFVIASGVYLSDSPLSVPGEGTWHTYNISSLSIPLSAKGVILKASINNTTAQGTLNFQIRKDESSLAWDLLNNQNVSIVVGDTISSVGFFPLNNSNSFQYKFDYNGILTVAGSLKLSIIGYFE